MKVCIATIDPRGRGGVFAMQSFIYEFLYESGYQPSLLFLSEKDTFRLKKPKTWRLPFLKREVVRGMDSVVVGGWLPYLRFLQYVIFALATRSCLKDFDIYQVTAGVILDGLPFALHGKKFVAWIATTAEDEWRAQYCFQKSADLDIYIRLNTWLLPIQERFERFVFQRAARILALSTHIAEQIISKHGIPEEKIQVVPCPIDTGIFYPRENKTSSTTNRFLFCAARINDPRKNIRMLLRAFALIRKAVKDVRLVLAGGKPAPALSKLCSELKLDGAVTFLDMLERYQLVEYYQQAEVFVLPSLQEGLGIVLLEAMACGLSVVATRCGGPEDVVIDGKTGFLVPNNDENEMATACVKLLQNKKLRQEMSQNALRHVREHFSIEAIQDRFLRVYQDVYPELFGE